MLVAMQAQSIRPIALIRGALQLNRPLTRVLVLTALLVSLVPFFKGISVHAATPEVSDSGSVSVAVAQESSLGEQLPVLPADGLYLFGQAPVADQIGAGYMVFEAEQQRVVGALYMPDSSFDCFHGELGGTELAMTITNSYTQETYPYSIALQTNDAIASTSADSVSPLSLEGFYRLASPSANDLRMLEICKNGL